MPELPHINTPIARLLKEGIPIQTGFYVAPSAFDQVRKTSHLDRFITTTLASLDTKKAADLEIAAKKISRFLLHVPIDQAILDQILEAYLSMDEPRVMLSEHGGTDEHQTHPWDTPYHLYGIQGEANLFVAIRQMWAHRYQGHHLFRLAHHKEAPPNFALAIQRLPEAFVSGICLTRDPTIGKQQCLIKAVYGEGALDHHFDGADYLWADMTSGRQSRLVSDRQLMEYSYHQGKRQRSAVPISRQQKPKVSEALLKEITTHAKKIHQLSLLPQEFLWIWDKHSLSIIDIDHSRWCPAAETTPRNSEAFGVSMYPGIVSGPVRIVTSSKDAQAIRPGEIVILSTFDVSALHHYKKSRGIIIEERLSPGPGTAQITELGLPCIVGVAQATRIFKPSQSVTISTPTGRIFQQPSQPPSNRQRVSQLHPRIGTEYALPLHYRTTSSIDITGSLMIKPDTLIALFGHHPLELVSQKKTAILAHAIEERIIQATTAIHAPISWYTFSDLRPSDYRRLTHGSSWEENNLDDAFHGSIRLIHQPELYTPEIEALQSLYRHHPTRLGGILFPSVRSSAEYKAVSTLLGNRRLGRRAGCLHGLLMTIPSLAWQLDECIQIGVDYVIIDVDEIATHLYGADPAATEFAPLRVAHHDGVLQFVSSVVHTCRSRGVPLAIRANTLYADATITAMKQAHVEQFIVPHAYLEHMREYIDTVYHEV